MTCCLGLYKVHYYSMGTEQDRGAQIQSVLVLDYSVDGLEREDRNTVGFVVWITCTKSRLRGQGRNTLFRITVFTKQGLVDRNIFGFSF
jgi:hypothetical protein